MMRAVTVSEGRPVNVPRALVLLTMLGLSPGPEASACCAPSQPGEALGHADAVFRGRVVALQPAEAAARPDVLTARAMPERWRDVAEQVAEMAVLATWKGVREDFVRVRGGHPQLSGSISFEAGEEYVVFARREADGTWSAQPCWGTAILAHAADTLAALGAPLPSGSSDESLRILLADMLSPEVDRRVAACRGLALRPEAASASVPRIARCMEADRESSERRAAIEALGSLGPAASPALPALAAMLRDPDPELGADAALALGHVGVVSELVVRSLVACALDEAPERAAERELERLPVTREAELPDLERRLESLAVRREAALESLRRLGEPAAPYAASEILEALIAGRLGSHAVPALVAMGHGDVTGARAAQVLAENPDAGGAIRILEALGPSAPPAVVPMLVRRIQAESPRESHEAIRTLRAMGPSASEAVPALLSALDAMPVSEYEIVQALAAIGDPRSAPVLARAALHSEITAVPGIARRALGAMGLDPSRIAPAGDRFGRLLAPIGDDALAVAARDALHVFDVTSGRLVATIPNPGAPGTDFPRALTAIDARRFAASAGALGGSLIVFDRSGTALALATSPAPRMFAEFGAFGERVAFAQGRLVATLSRIDAASFVRAFREGDRSVGAVSMGEDWAFLAYQIDGIDETAMAPAEAAP